jgi:peptidoglycan-associated lipoprotein
MDSTRIAFLFSVSLGSLGLAACGGAKPETRSTAGANAPVPTAAEQIQSKDKNKNANDNGTSGVISIAEDIRKACGISDPDAYFPFDSARLTSKDITPLNKVASCFRSGALQGHALKLVGRADPRGTEEYNIALGQSRADSVAIYLSVQGLDKAKALSSSRGALDATGHDESTWALDRRVDLLLGP